MKKGILVTSGVVLAIAAAIFAFNGTSVASMKYECWTYVNSHPDKMTYIVAETKSEAEKRAQKKFRELGVSWDRIKCH